jgi:hypothetical protein
MATYDDFDGVWFTIQALRLSQPELRDDVTYLVLDNNPTGPVAEALRELESRIPRYRYVPFDGYHGTAVRDLLFWEAEADVVCCVDSHVLIEQGGLQAVRSWFAARPDSRDLLQGPLLYDDLKVAGATHLAPTWGAGMYGQWALDPRGANSDSEPFEIDMQGLGVFACRRKAWPRLNPRFRGFGGEEGYLHEKVRQNGGRVLCHPALRWAHRFSRPAGAPYPNLILDRVRNYRIGWSEIGWGLAPVEEHFRELLGDDVPFEEVLTRAAAEAAHPLNRFDAVFCTTGKGACAAAALSEDPGVGWRIECSPPPASTSQLLGRTASWRWLLETALVRGYEQVLVVEGEARPEDRRHPGALTLPGEGDRDLSFGWVGDGAHRRRAVGVRAGAFECVMSSLPAGDARQFLALYGDLDRCLLRLVEGGHLTVHGVPHASHPDRPRHADNLTVDWVTDGLIVTDGAAERLHRLNSTAAFVFEACDGEQDLASVILQFQDAFALDQPPADLVESCLAELRALAILA